MSSEHPGPPQIFLHLLLCSPTWPNNSTIGQSWRKPLKPINKIKTGHRGNNGLISFRNKCHWDKFLDPPALLFIDLFAIYLPLYW